MQNVLRNAFAVSREPLRVRLRPDPATREAASASALAPAADDLREFHERSFPQLDPHHFGRSCLRYDGGGQPSRLSGTHQALLQARQLRQPPPLRDTGAEAHLALPNNHAQRNHPPALPHAQVAAAVVRVRHSGAYRGTVLAFEFLVLTGCRSGEVASARWDEIDLEAAVWTIPAERIKARREHRVPLSDRRSACSTRHAGSWLTAATGCSRRLLA